MTGMMKAPREAYRVKAISILLWGVEKPSRLRMLVLSVAFVILATFFVGYRADFIPSSEWNMTVVAASGLLTLVAMLWVVYRLWHRPLNERRRIRDFLARAGGCVAVAIIIFALSWACLAEGCGYLLTLAIGKEMSQRVWLRKDTGGRGCFFRLKGAIFSNAMPGYLCISFAQYKQMPPSGFVRLHGTQSWFGFAVTSWQLEP